MPQRLAIVISGAVSLGSYEAGVLYEVLRALEIHNQQNADPAKRIEIDVLVGASAGSMTAAIVAQVLIGGCDRLRSAHDNPFYQTWVKDVGLDELLRYRPVDTPSCSLLSGAFIDELGVRHLAGPPAGQPHSCLPQGRDICLAFALSNLRGIDYDVTRDAAHPYTRFQDEWRHRISTNNPDAADWAGIRRSAIASGAFPAAFPVRAIERDRSDYSRHVSPADWPASEPKRIFPYVDGGVFNNEPLGLAKEAVDTLDKHRDNEHRFYLFVSPSPKKTKTDREFPTSGATILRMVWRLLQAVYGQAQYQDISALQKMNRRLAHFDRIAEDVARALAADPAAALAFANTAELLNRFAFRPTADEATENAEAARARLLEDFATSDWFNSWRQQHPQLVQPWLALIAAFERAASLGEKDHMQLLAIFASDDELLGDPLVHFGGFTCEAVRHYDYELGRLKAQRWLQSPDNTLTGRLNNFEPCDHHSAHAHACRELAACADRVGEQLGERVAEAILARSGSMFTDWLRSVGRNLIKTIVKPIVRAELRTEARNAKPPA